VSLWEKVSRRLNGATPELREAWLRGVKSLRGILPDGVVARLIQLGPDPLLDVLTPAKIDQAFYSFRLSLRGTLERTAVWTGKGLPRALSGVTDLVAPSTLAAIRDLDTRVMARLAADIRETVRNTVGRGLAAGRSPLTIAQQVRGFLPLAPNQAAAVANFRRMLVAGDTEALTRALRDPRFDALLARALGKGGSGLSALQVDRMVGAYQTRMIAWNADTVTRSAALGAIKQGQWLAWKQVLERGLPQGQMLMKRWESMGDEKVRPEHREMNGQVVPAEMLYSNGEMIPGESTYNCRCLSDFFMGADA